MPRRPSNVKNGNRRIFLVTDDDDPCRVKAAQDALASQSQKISPRKKKLTKEAARFGRVEDEITDISRTADRVRVRPVFGSRFISSLGVSALVS